MMRAPLVSRDLANEMRLVRPIAGLVWSQYQLDVKNAHNSIALRTI